MIKKGVFPLEPKVYIVLVNWNGWADSIECIESLLHSRYSNYEIILVDNGSTDDSVIKIKEWAADSFSLWISNTIILRKFSMPPHANPISCVEHASSEIASVFENRGAFSSKCAQERYQTLYAKKTFHLIISDRNGGFGAGNNLALKLVQLRGDGDFIWLLNNDTVVTSNAMTEMVGCAQENNGIVGATLFYYHIPDKIQAYGGGYFSQATGIVRTATHTRPNHLDFINGASFMFSSQILQAVGFFDENIFLYFEEFDYCFRAENKGYRCFLSDAVVYHKHGASSSNADDSFAWRHILKNKPYVLKKNFGYGFWLLFFIFGVIFSALGLASTSGKRTASRAVIAEWAGRFCYRGTSPLGEEKIPK